MNQSTFEQVVRALGTSTDKDGERLRMDSIIVSQGEQVYSHVFSGSNDARNDVRSVCKPLLCMAIGRSLEEGLILDGLRMNLDSPIWPLLEGRFEVANAGNITRLKEVRLRHLLTHTIGYDVGLLFSKDIKGRDPFSLVEYVLNFDIPHEPGEHFVYSNVGPYLFSVIIQEHLGVGLAEWVDGLLFSQMGVVNFEWRNYGRYCAASSGLQLSNTDLHKLGRLFVDRGVYQDRAIIPEGWLRLMSQAQVQTPSMYDEARVFPKFGYGFGLWVCKNGTFYCDGTDGQYLIVLPNTGTVITTFGRQGDMKPITECLRPLLG